MINWHEHTQGDAALNYMKYGHEYGINDCNVNSNYGPAHNSNESVHEHWHDRHVLNYQLFITKEILYLIRWC